jgi:hypothetical protein
MPRAVYANAPCRRCPAPRRRRCRIHRIVRLTIANRRSPAYARRTSSPPHPHPRPGEPFLLSPWYFLARFSLVGLLRMHRIGLLVRQLVGPTVRVAAVPIAARRPGTSTTHEGLLPNAQWRVEHLAQTGPREGRETRTCPPMPTAAFLLVVSAVVCLGFPRRDALK